ncbi:MAG: glycosyltransferase family 2 protein [Candidatus Pacearchaeota archaeon]|jgi:glycosyltransferase involved in cell wall biosynthesis
MNNKQQPELSITIPVYNEEKGIGRTVKNLVNEFEKQKINYELVLVNHGSWDNTKEVLEKLGKTNNRLNIINLEKNLGYGGGIMYGFRHSNGENIGWVCADEETSAEDACRLYQEFRQNKYDVVKAIRTNRTDGEFRKFTSFIFNKAIAIRFRLNVKDTNGYPFYMKKQTFETLEVKEKTHLFNLDLLYEIRKKKYTIKEIPVVHGKRKTGKTFMKPSRIIEMAFDLLKYSLK